MDAQSKIAALLKDFLSVEQAAAELGIKPRAVQTACQRGQLPGAIQLGREWRIPPTAVAARKKTFGVGQIPQKLRPNRKAANDLEHAEKTAKKSRPKSR